MQYWKSLDILIDRIYNLSEILIIVNVVGCSYKVIVISANAPIAKMCSEESELIEFKFVLFVENYLLGQRGPG